MKARLILRMAQLLRLSRRAAIIARLTICPKDAA